MNLNKVLLLGRLTRDPQLRYTPSGTAVADLGLAVNRTFTDGSGQRREETCFVDAVVWKKQAELCHKHLRKGSPIFIEGRLTYESWEGQDGQRRSRLKVVTENFQFVDQPGDRGQDARGDVPQPPTVAQPYPQEPATPAPPPSAHVESAPAAPPAAPPYADEPADEIPF